MEAGQHNKFLRRSTRLQERQPTKTAMLSAIEQGHQWMEEKIANASFYLSNAEDRVESPNYIGFTKNNLDGVECKIMRFYIEVWSHWDAHLHHTCLICYELLSNSKITGGARERTICSPALRAAACVANRVQVSQRPRTLIRESRPLCYNFSHHL
jgi:hypothetical protein